MKNTFKLTTALSLVFILFAAACNKEDKTTSTTTPVTSGNDPNFTIVSHTDASFSSFNRKVEVFDIPIYAVAGVEDARLLHAANIMAQYLDNNEDGVVDNLTVLAVMKANNAFMVMWKKENDLDNLNPPNNAEGQDLGNDETIPNWHTNGHSGQFDAALEEVWHIITHAGYASAYPAVFGEDVGSTLTDAMDLARGGRFTTIPIPYPANAWYTYDDATCDYNCMATEYIYWAMSSILGAQENRLGEIDEEWRANTKTKVEAMDPAIYNLLTDTQYMLPTVLPDGSYKH